MAGSQRTYYADADDKAGALRVEACATCHKYLIDIDLARDPRAVPEVDELTALPLDLFAAEHGLSKVTPNLMGF
jgi:formate dehydrogenase maturation protein FdhE